VRADPAVSAGHSRYMAPHLGRMRPLAGAAELLRATGRLGLNVVLATSAKDEELDFMLDALGACDAVNSVVSSGAMQHAKPAPDIVHKALAESATDPAHAVMVGDTVWDVKAAQQAGVPCIGLLSGGISECELRAAGAAETYRSPAGLLDDLVMSRIGRLADPAGQAWSAGRPLASWPGCPARLVTWLAAGQASCTQPPWARRRTACRLVIWRPHRSHVSPAACAACPAGSGGPAPGQPRAPAAAALGEPAGKPRPPGQYWLRCTARTRWPMPIAHLRSARLPGAPQQPALAA
jgi:hypothetical protein